MQICHSRIFPTRQADTASRTLPALYLPQLNSGIFRVSLLCLPCRVNFVLLLQIVQYCTGTVQYCSPWSVVRGLHDVNDSMCRERKHDRRPQATDTNLAATLSQRRQEANSFSVLKKL